jgi:hypothetical protein
MRIDFFKITMGLTLIDLYSDGYGKLLYNVRTLSELLRAIQPYEVEEADAEQVG